MEKKKLPLIYIVVPCYNEEAVLEETTKQLLSQLHNLMEEKTISCESKIAYVNDGSKDRTWEMIEKYSNEYYEVCGICLSRNFGHQNALLAGMSTFNKIADAIITIDADLQDDITVISQMVNCLSQGFDIVYGVRKQRNTDTFFKRSTAVMFYKLMSKLGVNTVYNHADYRLMSKRAIEQLLNFRERNLFLRGIVPLIGYNTCSVYYDRMARFAGESKYPLNKMMNFAFDGITSFSIKPLRLIFTIGILFILLSLIVLLWVIGSMLYGNTVRGWTSIIISIWLVGGMLLVSIGIAGEYIGKIYTEVKNRPRYIIEKITDETL